MEPPPHLTKLRYGAHAAMRAVMPSCVRGVSRSVIFVVRHGRTTSTGVRESTSRSVSEDNHEHPLRAGGPHARHTRYDQPSSG
ncbi:MAG: hypothetical protein JWP76_1644 [Dactylosporangium sp.]|nr:hypothetical protein [Dactylosporangium sp.]